MKKLGLTYILLVLLVLLFALSGCTGAPKGTGHGVEGYIEGIVRFDNSRVRCGFTQSGSYDYRLLCQAVVVDDLGQESLAKAIAPGVSLEWNRPKRIEGAEIVSSSCSVDHNDLSQKCDITLATNDRTKIEVAVNIIDSLSQRQKVESDELLLPFSINSFGVIPQLPVSYLAVMSAASASRSNTESVPSRYSVQATAQANPEPADLVRVGYQNILLEAANTYFPAIGSTCVDRERTYFTSGSRYIYLMQDGKVTLYAGSASSFQKDDLSHRRRIFLGRNLWIACKDRTLYVSDRLRNRILRIQDSGPASVVAAYPSPGPIAISQDDSLYVVTHYNAADGVFMRIRVSNSGEKSVVSAERITRQPVGLVPYAIAPDADGSLYVTGFYYGNNYVKKIDLQGLVTNVIGTGEAGYSGDGGPATDAMLNRPQGVAVGPDGSLYIADTGNNRIRKVEKSSGKISTFAGTGNVLNGSCQSNTANIGRSAVTVDIGAVSVIAAASDGSIYFRESENLVNVSSGRLLRIDPTGNVYPLTSSRAGCGAPSSNVDATVAQIKFANGIAIGPDQSLYIAETNGHRVVRVAHDPSTHKDILTTVAGTGVAGFSGDGGSATDAQLSSPNGISFAPDGTLYIADTANFRIRAVKQGAISTIAGLTNAWIGSVGNLSLGDGLPAKKAAVAAVQAIVVGNDGAIYFSDPVNCRVRKIDTSGIISTIINPNGAMGVYDCQDSALGPEYIDPAALAIDSDGSLLIADNRNHQILEYQESGITVLAGNGQSPSGPQSGWANEVGLGPLKGLSVDGDGKIYFVETFNYSYERDRMNSYLRTLEPVRTTDGTTKYIVSTVYGGPGVARDCGGGAVRGLSSRNDLAGAFASSLSVLCSGRLLAVSSTKTCQNGKSILSFSQTLDWEVNDKDIDHSSVVRIESPCTKP